MTTTVTHGATGMKSPKDAAADELHEAAKDLLILMDSAGIVDLWRNDLKIGAAMGRLKAAVDATMPPAGATGATGATGSTGDTGTTGTTGATGTARAGQQSPYDYRP